MLKASYHELYPKMTKWLVLAIAIILPVILIRHLIYAGPLWRDEIAHINHSMMSLSDMWSYATARPFPLFSMLIIHALGAIGIISSDLSIRIFGVIVYLITFFSVWLWMKKLSFSGHLLWILVFFNPSFFWIATAARPYGLGLLFSLNLFLLFLSLNQSFTLKKIIILNLLSILAVHTMFQNAFVVFAATVASVIVFLKRREWIPMGLFIASGSITALTLLPYSKILAQAGQWAVLTKAELPFVHYLRAMVYTFGDISTLTGKIHLLAWAVLICFGLFRLGGKYTRKQMNERDKNTALFLIFSGMISVSLLFITVYSSRVMPQHWHYSFILLMSGIMVSVIFQLEGRGLWLFAIIVLALFSNIVPLWHATTVRQTNMDIVAELLEKSADKNDLIIVNPWYFGTTFDRYYDGEAPWLTLPPLGDHKLTRYDLLQEAMKGSNAISKVIQAAENSLSSNGDVWHVGYFPKADSSINMSSVGPAPDKIIGWSAAGYARHWSTNLANWIRAESLTTTRIKIKDKHNYHPYSRVSLYKISKQ